MAAKPPVFFRVMKIFRSNFLNEFSRRYDSADLPDRSVFEKSGTRFPSRFPAFRPVSLPMCDALPDKTGKRADTLLRKSEILLICREFKGAVFTMIITLKKTAPEQAVNELIADLESRNLSITKIVGENYDVFGLVGDTASIDERSLLGQSHRL